MFWYFNETEITFKRKVFNSNLFVSFSPRKIEVLHTDNLVKHNKAHRINEQFMYCVIYVLTNDVMQICNDWEIIYEENAFDL